MKHLCCSISLRGALNLYYRSLHFPESDFQAPLLLKLDGGSFLAFLDEFFVRVKIGCIQKLGIVLLPNGSVVENDTKFKLLALHTCAAGWHGPSDAFGAHVFAAPAPASCPSFRQPCGDHRVIVLLPVV